MEGLIPVTLPGGVLLEGELRDDLLLHPPDGRVEERIALLSGACATLPEGVTGVLASAIHSIAGRPADPGAARSLCVADRQWLMLTLARHLHGGGLWLQENCPNCGGAFDLYVDPGQVPVKERGPGFPYVEVETAGLRLRLRVPTGADQEKVAARPEAEAEAVCFLLESCLLAVNGEEAPPGFTRHLERGSLAAIEEGLEAAAPQVGTTLCAACPECGAAVLVEIDPYRMHPDAGELFREVHVIASHYHWSEDAILSLSRNRRRRYLRLIEREQGSKG